VTRVCVYSKVCENLVEERRSNVSKRCPSYTIRRLLMSHGCFAKKKNELDFWLVGHPPYSPDFAPSDLLRKIKKKEEK
jgi:hypothetical protein